MTLLFSDLVGSTMLSEQRRAGAAARPLRLLPCRSQGGGGAVRRHRHAVHGGWHPGRVRLSRGARGRRPARGAGRAGPGRRDAGGTSRPGSPLRGRPGGAGRHPHRAGGGHRPERRPVGPGAGLDRRGCPEPGGAHPTGGRTRPGRDQRRHPAARGFRLLRAVARRAGAEGDQPARRGLRRGAAPVRRGSLRGGAVPEGGSGRPRRAEGPTLRSVGRDPSRSGRGRPAGATFLVVGEAGHRQDKAGGGRREQRRVHRGPGARRGLPSLLRQRLAVADRADAGAGIGVAGDDGDRHGRWSPTSPPCGWIPRGRCPSSVL